MNGIFVPELCQLRVAYGRFCLWADVQGVLCRHWRIISWSGCVVCLKCGRCFRAREAVSALAIGAETRWDGASQGIC